MSKDDKPMTAATPSGPGSSKQGPITGDAPLLVAEGLGCGHGDRSLLTGISLTLDRDDALAVVGPNGAGKSTLLLTLAGLLRPLRGRITLLGQDLDRMPSRERARRAALLPQAEGSLHDLTIRELVELGRTPHLGLFGHLGPQDHRAVDEALEACELGPLAGRKLATVSGGERQRARIALTLAQEAPLLFLDEPDTHLDLKRRFQLFELLARLRRDRHLGVVLVLHDLREAFRTAGQVLLLDRGTGRLLGADDEDRLARLAEAFDVPCDFLSL